ncbi:MAG: PQQ-binding-like beta-propeller repeat protein [Halanaeroarchaeum sp.]
MPSPLQSPSTTDGSTTRRRFLAAAATGVVGALAGCATGSPPPVSLDRWWRQYGYDAANTANNPDARGPTAPVVGWTHQAGAYHRGNQPLAIPEGVVVNTGYDGVYVLDGGGAVAWHDAEDYTGLAPAVPDSLLLPTGYGFRGVSREGGFSLFGFRTGYEHWRTHATDPESPPTFDGQLAVAGIGVSGHSNGGGRVSAFDVRSGEHRWSAPVETTVTGAPAVDGGLVFAADRGGYDESQEPAPDRYVYAFDRENGAEQWRTRITGDPWASVVDAPVVGDGRVHVAAGPGSVYTLDATTGEAVWHRDLGPVQASPALADDRLFVATMDRGLVALDAATGETVWHRDFEMAFAGPVVVGDRCYLVGAEGHLAAVERDGTLAWDEQFIGEFTTPPLVDHMTVYVGSTAGTLHTVGQRA